MKLYIQPFVNPVLINVILLQYRFIDIYHSCIYVKAASTTSVQDPF